MTPSAHVDTFARDHLPTRELWPDFIIPEGSVVDYPERLNCAVALLDEMVEHGRAESPLFHTDNGIITYEQFRADVDRIAHVLVDDMGVVPGNRVLLRGPNTPMISACWFAVMKVGGICVTTMPLLRAGELAFTAEKARIRHALCDARFAEDLARAREQAPLLEHVVLFGGSGEVGSLEARMAGKSDYFEAVSTAGDDVALIAFTSGTTGQAKATMHFHRDVLAICDAFPRECMEVHADDVFTGTPPLAFTFGLGGLLLFPMRFGASIAFVEKPGVDTLLETIQKHRATTCFTSPTAYRAVLQRIDEYDVSSLRECVSAGEPLPAPTFHAWREATGLKIIDGIGSTEMLHIFISAPIDRIRPGTTGKPFFPYEAKVVDRDTFEELPPGEVGLLAVRGPTGCRYLADDERQREYVRDGWNYPGDAYLVDEDGFFHYQSRADDMIISAGYNISGLEVESVLLAHDAVAECGVIGIPDDERGHLVKACVVLRNGHEPGPETARMLQDFVKAEIAPYKYPRAIEFMDQLPRTQTGKLQRFRLREME